MKQRNHFSRFCLPLLLILLMLSLLLLTACTGTGNPADSTEADSKESTSESEEQTESGEPSGNPNFDDEAIYLFVNQSSGYSIVRPDISSQDLIDASVNFRIQFNTCYGVKLPIGTDFIKGNPTNVENDELEILIGDTNRKESADVKATLEKDTYKICVVNNKLIIVGYDGYATVEALTYFTETYLKSGEDLLRIERSLEVVNEASVQKVKLTAGADLRIMTWNLLISDDQNTRSAAMRETILFYLPDVIGLQECNSKSHTQVVDQLSDYYAVATERHPGSSTYIYTPILYLKDKYTVVETGGEWLKDRFTGTNTKSLSWAVLRRNADGKEFAVINFHGAVASKDYAGYENYTPAQLNELQRTWRIGNVNQIQDKITALRKTHPDITYFITGDYNMNSDSDPYKLLVSYGYAEAELTADTASTGTKSTHAVGSAPASGKSIDHIFYNADARIHVYLHSIVKTATALSASDHCPVYADISLGE